MDVEKFTLAELIRIAAKTLKRVSPIFLEQERRKMVLGSDIRGRRFR
jgi:hypothetical protein